MGEEAVDHRFVDRRTVPDTGNRMQAFHRKHRVGVFIRLVESLASVDHFLQQAHVFGRCRPHELHPARFQVAAGVIDDFTGVDRLVRGDVIDPTASFLTAEQRSHRLGHPVDRHEIPSLFTSHGQPQRHMPIALLVRRQAANDDRHQLQHRHQAVIGRRAAGL